MTVELTAEEAQWLSILAAEALRNDSGRLAHHRSAYDALQEACNWEGE